MKQLILIIMFGLMVTACGKKPNTLLIPEVPEGQVRHYPLPYPEPHPAPPATKP